MASQKQIEANRRNAAKSTGPVTTAGKNAVRLNALQHGLTASIPLLPDEDQKELDVLCAGLTQALNPQGALEENLVQRIILLSWRLKRLCKIETGLLLRLLYEEIIDREQNNHMQDEVDESLLNTFSRGQTSQTLKEAKQNRDSDLATMGAAYRNDTQKSDALAKLLRYETTLEKSFTRALHELQRLQAQRTSGVVVPPLAVDVTVTHDALPDVLPEALPNALPDVLPEALPESSSK